MTKTADANLPTSPFWLLKSEARELLRYFSRQGGIFCGANKGNHTHITRPLRDPPHCLGYASKVL